jgi:ankyrin repeat protein
MGIPDLPTELVLLLGASLETERDINALSRTSRRLFNILNSYLYAYDCRNSNSALGFAAMEGIEATARMSIQQGGKVEVTDHCGRGPVSWAAQNGHKTVIDLMLSTGKVKINEEDSELRTPITWAAESGQEAVVKLLLGIEQVQIDLKDETLGRTPLS